MMICIKAYFLLSIIDFRTNDIEHLKTVFGDASNPSNCRSHEFAIPIVPSIP